MKNRNFFRKLEPYFYLLPILIGIVLVNGGAVLAAFGISLTNWDIINAPTFIGTGNYTEMMNSEIFWKALKNTLYFVALYVPTSVIGAIGLAVLVNRKLRGITFFKTAYFFPVVTSMVAITIVWTHLYQPETGTINYILKHWFFIQNPPQWLASSDWALPAMVIMSVWKNLGYNMLVILAGLQHVPVNLDEAALLDGAGPFKRFFSVTLPMISPSVFFVIVITVIGAFQTFEQTFMLTKGGPANSTLMLGYFIWQNGFEFLKMGYATAMAYVLFALTLIVTVIQFRMQKRWVYYG